MAQFREHRGQFNESLKTLIRVNSRRELIQHCRDLLNDYGFEFRDTEFHVKPYRYEPRLKWDQHVVTIDRYGVIGFTDGPL